MIKPDMAKALKWTAAVVILIGVVCSGWHIAEFSDGNLGLMIGIGFLIGGVQILILGAVAPYFQKAEGERETAAGELRRNVG